MTKQDFQIYLDHAASSPVDKVLLQQAIDVVSRAGNAFSAHAVGQNSAKILSQSRQKIAKILKIPENESEIIFTSGASESAALGILGSVRSLSKNSRKISLSPFSHSAITSVTDFAIEQLETETQILQHTDGQIFPMQNIADIIVLESANSETGHRQSWEELATPSSRIIVDGSASLMSEIPDFSRKFPDMFFFSGEKIGALAGSGVLIKSKNCLIVSHQSGVQEGGYRGGSHNLFGIYILAEVLEKHAHNITKIQKHFSELQKFSRKFFSQDALLSQQIITTPESQSVGHIFHFILRDQRSDVFVAQADLQGICISAGSACSSKSQKPSVILQSLGYSDAQSRQGVRVSFSPQTTIAELKKSYSIFASLLKS